MEITKEELQDQVILKLKKASFHFQDEGNKMMNFQLQLITIAAATFSIYIAFGNTNATVSTKWGFIFLAVSLLSGLLSVMSKFFHGFFTSFWQVFDIEKALFKSEALEETRSLFVQAGYSAPMAYKEKMDADFLDGFQKQRMRMSRKFSESSLNSISGFFGGIQLAAILVATIFLLVGLLLLPVANTIS